MTDKHEIGPVVVETIDYVWERVRSRCDGIGQDEYLWEPTLGAWSVREESDGTWRCERPRPEPDPPPVTTIAWRLWHVASECLAGYTVNGLGEWSLPGLEPGSLDWYPDVGEALVALDRSWAGFRDGVDRLGEEGMWRSLGDGWGPYHQDPWVALVLHAMDELVHHRAEIALLRDLWGRRADRA